MSHTAVFRPIVTLMAGAVLLGCGSAPTPPPATPPDSPRISLSSIPGQQRVAEAAEAAQWVLSDDKQLALRLSSVAQTIVGAEQIQVVAQLRNTGNFRVTVLRPFGDWYAAQAAGLKVWDRKQRIAYSGPNASYVIGADAFTALGPGEVVEERLTLISENFAVGSTGEYTLRFDYSYQGQWDVTAAAGNSGIRDAWRGTICSREVRVLRK